MTAEELLRRLEEIDGFEVTQLDGGDIEVSWWHEPAMSVQAVTGPTLFEALHKMLAILGKA